MGLGLFIVQSRGPSNSAMFSTLFWLSVALGVLMASFAAVFSGVAAEIMDAPPGFRSALTWIAASFPFGAAVSVFVAVDERSLNFKKVALIEVAASCVAVFSAIFVALCDGGFYALVTQVVLAPLISFALYILVKGWRPSFYFSVTEASSMARFSANVVAFNISNYVARNADAALIGRVLGSVALGVYSQAYRLMLLPVQNVSGVVIRVAYPHLVSNSHDPDRRRQIYVSCLYLVLAVTAPVMACLWFFREPFVSLVLGRQWLEVAGLLAWLAPVGVIQSLVSTTSIVYFSSGDSRSPLIISVVSASAQLAVFAATVALGLLAVTASYFAIHVLLGVLLLRLAMRKLKSDLNVLLRGLAPVIATTALMLIYLVLVFGSGGVTSILMLITGFGSALAFYGAAMWLLARRSVSSNLDALR